MAGTDDDRKSAEKGPDPEKGPKKKSIGKWIGIGAAAAIGGVGAIIATPVVLGAVGFTSAGIAAGSWAAGMMSSAAIANGGGVAAGSFVAILQSVGAAGLGAAGAAAVGGTGAAAAAGVAAGTAKVIDSVRTDSDGSSQAPRFLNKEKYADGQSLHSGETLEIHFEGHPTPSVNWSQDDGNMEHTPIIKTDDGNGVTSLSVGKVEGVVVIRYTVTLANEVGKDELKVKVVLIGDSPDNAKKPALKSGPFTTHSKKDSGINPTAGGNQSPRFVTQEESLDLPVICSGQAFKIYYEGQPAPSVSWKMDHGSMKNPPSFQTSYGNGVATLEVGNVSSTGSLCFTVALQNEVGQEEKQFKITVVA